MNLILTVDDNFGISFAGKRQARDKVLNDYIFHLLSGKKLHIKIYSADIFDKDKVVIINDTNELGINDYYFHEVEEIVDFSTVNMIVLCHWNRDYPFDFAQKIPNDFKLVKIDEICGSSHEKITVEFLER